MPTAEREDRDLWPSRQQEGCRHRPEEDKSVEGMSHNVSTIRLFLGCPGYYK